MTKSALAISLAVLMNINAAAHSQNSVVANPVFEGTAHPGTAILDAAGIYAGVPTPNSVRCILGQPFWIQWAFLLVIQLSMAALRWGKR